jgi:nitroreductase
VLAEVIEINRAQAFTEPPSPLGRAVPDLAPSTLSWAELLWRRTSGRMPRGLHGISGRPGPLPRSALTDALAWLAVLPPSRTLAAVADAVTVTAALHTVDNHTPGVYRVEHGALAQYSDDPAIAANLERVYGYPQAPDNGSDIRNAAMIWFLSVRPRELARMFGPGGWTAAQYVCGWLTHGLCLAAGASGNYARPVRAFTEIPTQHILGLPPDEMIMLAVVVGTPRPTGGPVLDLRL